MLNALGKAIRTVSGRIREQGIRTTALWAYGRGIPKMTGAPLLEYSRVTESLYVGPQYRASGKRTLLREGVTHVVNLRSEFDDKAHGLTLAGDDSTHYCYLPTTDDHPISADDMAIGIAFIDKAVKDGGRVYIHCSAGVGRAPSMAAAYLISRGYSTVDALALIGKARPFIRPTPQQIMALRQFEDKKRGEPAAAG